jgi:serine/threonine protein kinase/tetratricopeptide (TPR) repeat protein
MNEETLFHMAREKPPDQRAVFLDKVCAGDTSLRARLEILLAAHEHPGSFLQPADQDNGNGEVASDGGRTVYQSGVQEGPGTIIGPYKLLQQIGEGGMGVVFMAEQSQPVRRTVALKIIKPGMDSRQVIVRFEAERQALAMMDHPNIARVLDAGATDSGRPYFVMELVKGIPITQFCDEKQLSVRERLQVLLPVCQAVQHAHQKGVIHRDIKPTNILVAEYDNRAVPKVIDFGVAKATAQKLTERTMFTELGQVIGTVEYMSPEQAKLNQVDIDTRSDIYSLGVLLYELLTGSTPFERQRLREAAFDEVLRIIREEEPPKPSTKLSSSDTLPSVAANRHTEPARLSKDVRGELDWIVMKCLEKDRNRRYETANGMARDIERYLADEQVLACPPLATYRFRKFARRHRAGLLIAGGALIGLILLVIGLAANNRMIARERNEKAKALVEKEEALKVKDEALKLAQAESNRAEQNFRRVTTTISDAVTEAALGMGEFSSLPLPVRKRFAEETAKFNESLMQQDLRDPDLKYEAAVGHRSMGTLQNTFGDTQKAEQLTRRSLEMLDRLAGEHPTVAKYRHQLAWSSLCLARIVKATSRVDEAKGYFEKSATLYEALLKGEPTSRNYHNEIITCYRALSALYADRGDMTRGEGAILRAIAILEQAPSQQRADPAYPELLAQVQFSLAQLRARAGRIEEARSAFRDAAKRYEEAFSKQQSAPILYHWASCYYQLMELPGKNEKAAMAEAEQAFQQILDIRSRVPAELKDHQDLHVRFGHAFRSWGFMLGGTSRLGEAEQAFLEAAAIFDKVIAEDPKAGQYDSFAADSHHQAARLLMLGARNEDAERELRRAIEVYQQHATQFPDGEDCSALWAGACFDLARLLMKTGRSQEANPLITRAASFDDPAVQNQIAWNLATDPDPSFRHPKFAVELAERAVAARPGDGSIWNTLGVARYRNHQWKEAIAAFDKSMGLRNGGDAYRWYFLAMCHWQLGEKDEARKWYDKAVEWTEKNQPKNTQLRHFRTEAEELLKAAIKEPTTKEVK